MKLKKLISVITALSVVFVFVISVSYTFVVPASAIVADSYVSANEAPFLKDKNRTLYGYLSSYPYIPGQKNTVSIDLSPSTASDGIIAMPTLIKYSDLSYISTLIGNGYDIDLKFTICIPGTSNKYYATIKGSQISALSSLGSKSINLSLNFVPNTTEFRLYANTFNGGLSSLPIDINYDIPRDTVWKPLLISSGIYPKNDIAYFSIKSNSLMNTFPNNINGSFKINNSCITGVYFVDNDGSTSSDYITKGDAVALIKTVLSKKIGLTEEQINGSDPDFKNLTQYFKDAIDELSKDIYKNSGKYINKDYIDDIIEDYLEDKDNKDKLVQAVIDDQKLDEKIKNKLTELLGDDITLSQQKALIDYIKKSVTDEVTKQVGTYDTPSDLIKNAVAKAVDSAITDDVEQLKKDILDAITGGKTVEDFVNSLKGEKGDQGEQGIQGPQGIQGEQGEQGEQGIPGQNFEEWLIKRYGSEENFIQYIVSRVASGVKDGKSAYELALENGYSGSLSEWLESLKGEKGEDGRSAYEIAVAYGYTGSELEWLETLGSNSDKDIIEIGDETTETPEDDEDDSDSIYDDGVNGTYEDLGEDEEGPDPDSEEIIAVEDEEPEDEDENPDDEDENPDDEDENPDVVIADDNTGNNNHYYNPATGAALGILIPGAVIGSLFLIKKDKRKRGRR